MGAFTGLTLLAGPEGLKAAGRVALYTVTAPASYDAGGSTIDLSADFPSKVWGVDVVGQSTAGNDKYYATYIPAAAYAPATGKLKVRDLTAAADAEASGDLSAVAFVIRVWGA